MDRLESLEQYSELVGKAKKNIAHGISNIHFVNDTVQQFIQRGTFFYRDSSGGVQFYHDHGEYYRLFFLSDPDSGLDMKGISKPVFSYFLRKDKNDEYSSVNDYLIRNGFTHKNTLCGYDYEPEAIYSSLKTISATMKKTIEMSGFVLRYPKLCEYKCIADFMSTIDEIPYWQLDFPVESDFEYFVLDGRVQCIFDSMEKIVACQFFFPIGQYEYGWIAVDKKYRSNGAMASILTAEKMKKMIDVDHKGRGWINIYNSVSASFYTKLGYRENGRYREEYLMER